VCIISPLLLKPALVVLVDQVSLSFLLGISSLVNHAIPIVQVVAVVDSHLCVSLVPRDAPKIIVKGKIIDHIVGNASAEEVAWG
jgi:hypothetical protein